MPGVEMDRENEINGDKVVNELNDSSEPLKESSTWNMSPRSTLSIQSSSIEALNLPADSETDNSIKQLYDYVCEMQSSDQFPSRSIFGSDSEESRDDSELQHFVRGEVRREEEVVKSEDNIEGLSISNKENQSPRDKSKKIGKSPSARVKSVSSLQFKPHSQLQLDSNASGKSSPRSKISLGRPPTDKQNCKNSRKSNAGVVPIKERRNFALGCVDLQSINENSSEESLNDPRLGPRLLKQASDLISSKDDREKALELAILASRSFEICAKGKPSLQLVMSLHAIAAIYCKLGEFSEAILFLKRSIEIPVIEQGQDHALAKFAGHMQLGDTYAMLGQLENSIECYKMGLEVQKQVLGELDPKVGETYRFLAEAHIQALQFDEAEKLCRMALEIHRENGASSIEEAADRRLMGLIYETKGYHDVALEHLLLASMAMVTNGQEMEVASVDCSIGDAYLSLSRYNEAVFAYENSLTMYKTTKGENHPSVASVYVRLADLYNKMGKGKESKSYCENALQIYENPIPGTSPEEMAIGLTDVSAIYESMNHLEKAFELLQKALKMYEDAHSQPNTIAGIEAQMGVLYYMLGNHSDSYNSFKNAITKLRACGEKKSALFGITLNQMGLTCVQLNSIKEAADLFEEAMSILKKEYGPYHPDTLGVYSNLAGTYDAIGRWDDAIEILEFVVRMREEKLGTANPEVDDEKRRLTQLLKEAGRVQNREARSLKTLFDTNSDTIQNDGVKVFQRGRRERRTVSWTN
ncbi:Tetratricopeptide repeat-containing domain [Macleaya cordata]|uniref:Tetratricopeptide repeat-containing domain n=1 Tax=Macleaya cordata TaxID=56857 RepID=A0A200QHB2_MACCD|nr:Tetratricopeptide repeat-containing domain [Macleaya cordata]